MKVKDAVPIEYGLRGFNGYYVQKILSDHIIIYKVNTRIHFKDMSREIEQLMWHNNALKPF